MSPGKAEILSAHATVKGTTRERTRKKRDAVRAQNVEVVLECLRYNAG